MGLARAGHLPPTVAVTAFVTVLAAAAGRGAGTVWVALAVLTGHLSVGWSNDFVDRRRDRLAARLDKPIVAGTVEASTVAIAAGVAAAACVPLSLLSGWRAGLVHLAAVAIGWSYNFWLKHTPLSPLTFGVAFGAVPAFVTLGLPGHPLPPAWATAAAALLGAGAHFLNTLPDLDDDEQTGVRGLPHLLGAERSLVAGTVLLAAAIAVIAVGPPERLSAAGTAVALVALATVGAVVVMAAAGRPRTAWLLVLASAAMGVALFLVRGTELA